VDLTKRPKPPVTSGEFSARHIYEPISLEKSPVDWKVSPFAMAAADSLDEADGSKGKGDHDGGHSKEHAIADDIKQNARRPSDNIRKAWYWALAQLTADGRPHEIPLEWAVSHNCLLDRQV
jgi:hypothetical protein